jgi:hypothetical protein
MPKKIMAPKSLYRSQIIINLPPQSMEEIDIMMQSLGFSSRGQYLMFGHHALKTSIGLSAIEKSILLHLGEWGVKNFRETPDIATLARFAQYKEGDVIKTLEALELKSLLAKVSNVGELFQFDVKINQQHRYQLTLAGRAAARAALILSSRNI